MEKIGNLKTKLSNLNNVTFDSSLIGSMLYDECAPYMVGFGLKKISCTFVKCSTCRNKLTRGLNLDSTGRVLVRATSAEREESQYRR